jgi:S-adenosylmethionine hydrolase
MTEVTHDEMLMKAIRAYLRTFAKNCRENTTLCADEAEIKKVVKVEKEYMNLMTNLLEPGVDKGKNYLMTQIKSESNAGRFIKTYINAKYKDVRVWNSIHGTVKIMSK